MTEIKQDYKQKVADYYKSLSESSGDHFYELLDQLYSYVLSCYKNGDIDSKEFAYIIAGTMQFDLTKIGEYAKIAELAGDYELPDKHMSNNPDTTLGQLVSLIESL